MSSFYQQQIPVQVLTMSLPFLFSEPLWLFSPTSSVLIWLWSLQCTCWKKKTVINSMCLPTINVVGGRTGQHGGTSFVTMSIALYLLQISKQMLTMSCNSSLKSLLNCCHTHPQSLFGYNHSCAGEKKIVIITWLAIIDVDFDWESLKGFCTHQCHFQTPNLLCPLLG